MKSSKRKLLKGLAISSAWSTPVVNSVVLPSHAATTNPVPTTTVTTPPPVISTVTFTYTDTVAFSNINGIETSEPVTIAISFSATSLENQIFSASDVISYSWSFSTVTATINDNGSSWASVIGNFQTDGAGALIAVPSDWHDFNDVSVSGPIPVSAWFINGENSTFFTPGLFLNLTNVSNNINPAFWTISTS